MSDDAGQSGDNAAAGQSGEGDANQKGEESISLTQQELDRRMAEVRRGVESSLSKKYADYDDLKSKAAQFDQLQADQQSELEKAQNKAADAEKRAQDAEARAKAALTRSAVIAAATGKVVDPEAAFRLIDIDAITFDDTGQAANVAELIDQLVADKPYLAVESDSKKPPAGDKPADQGGQGTGTLAREDLKSMSPDEITKAREEGRLDHLLGAAS